MDVGKLVDKDTTIRSLNHEIARKQETIDDMKERLQRLLGAKEPVAGAENPAEVIEQLSKMLKNK